ncbi:MAG TPA: hypothetical protein VFK89_04605 [Actinomycetota bacterium]|nr:hypothetical protein [Actinomycetota bacterium]
MTPAGAIELPLLALQVAASIAAAWAGMRLVDDVKRVAAWRTRRARQQRPV